MGWPNPTADFCWEGRLACVIVLMVILWCFTALRFKALRGCKYKWTSPRGIASASVILVAILCTVYTIMLIWTYAAWYDLRGLQEMAQITREDDLIPIMKSMIPKNRDSISFCMRLILVTVLWLVKLSFVVIYYEFPKYFPKRTRILLHVTMAFIIIGYASVWIVTAVDWKQAMKRESFSPNAGAGVTLFLPPNSWSSWIPRRGGGWVVDSGFPSILRAELVITTLNVATDILLLVLVYSIFQHLCLASGRKQFRAASLLCSLFMISLCLALARLIVLCTTMQSLYARLTFDTLTDFEAFFCACAASIPAVRVLMRDYNSQNNTEAENSTSTSNTGYEKERPVLAFPEKWSLFTCRSSKTDEENNWEVLENSEPPAPRNGSVSGQGWAKRMDEARKGDSARAEALAPVSIGTVEVRVQGGLENEWKDPWADQERR